MARINSRNKGATAERDVANLIQPVVDKVYQAKGWEPPRVERNLEQVRRGGGDLVNILKHLIEVKNQSTLNIKSWWGQAKRQADGTDMEPVLVYKIPRRGFRVMMYGRLQHGRHYVRTPVDIPFDAFLAYLELFLTHNLESNVLTAEPG